MKRLLSLIRKLIPDYAWVYLGSFLAVNFVAFSLTQILMDDVTRYNLTLPIDDRIPLVPWFVIIYMIAFAQWAISWILISRESKEAVRYFAIADIISKLICLAVFVFYPTTMDRPSVEVTDLFTWILKNVIYGVDKPYNLLPSIHIIESHLALRAAFSLKKPPKFYRWIHIPLNVMIALSILFIKQHVFVDIPGGIIACEIGLFGAWLITKKRKLTSHER